MEERLEIQSNVFFGALNAVLVILTYAGVIAVAHFYLDYVHGINIVDIFLQSLSVSNIPLLSPVFEFISFLIEDIIVSTIIFSLIYIAYIANYKVVVTPTELTYRKGFLTINNEVFDIEDIEQVYTEKYTFFPNTRELCIKALDEDIIRIPYVRDAMEVKSKIIDLVKTRHTELEATNELHRPIKGGVPS